MTDTPSMWLPALRAHFSDGPAGPDQSDPSIAALPGGGFAVGWLTPFETVEFRLFDALGAASDEVRGVATADAYTGFDLAGTERGFDLGVVGRRAPGDFMEQWAFDAEGTRLEIQAGFVLGFPAESPTVALGGGSFFAAVDVTSPNPDVFGVVAGVQRRAGPEPDVQRAPDATRLADGRQVVAFEDQFSGTDEDVFFSLFEADGSVVVARGEVESIPGDQTAPAVAGLSDGGFAVAYVGDGGDGDGTGILMRRFDEDGVLIGSTRIVNVTTAGDQRAPAIVALSEGGVLVAWEDGASAGVLRARRFDDALAPVGEEFVLATGFRVTAPDLALLADGRVAATWSDLIGGDTDVFAAVLDPRGEVIFGGPDADVIAARTQGGVVRAGGGDDTVFGGAGADVLEGGARRDLLLGGRGRDELLGQGGRDELDGQGGRDLLVGGGGGDRIAGGGGADGLDGGGGGDRLKGESGGDALAGGRGRDKLLGGGGRDLLEGDGGRDALKGGRGRDTLDGGGGRDRLDGGGGADLFAFGLDDGSDRVLDFDLRRDRLDLTATSDDGFGDLKIRDRGDDAIVVHEGGRIRLEGISADEVTAGLFVFDDLAAV